jgi:ribosomal-protein-alanine N-acetyltransferase
MKFDFRIPKEKDSLDIATWKYDDIYSFYSNDKTKAKREWALNIHTEEDAYVIYNEDNVLIGHCSFDNEDGEVILGLQMKPEFTGQKMGHQFVEAILAFGKSKYDYDQISLYVAKFNKRAIKVYEGLGFKKIDEFTWDIYDEDVEFIVMEKQYEVNCL